MQTFGPSSELQMPHAVDFPGIAFFDEAVEKRPDDAIGATKEYLHNRGGAVHFY